MNRQRSGFTLVELLVVAVVGALVLGATYQVLVVNQRTYTAQNAQIQGQQSTRAAMEVLFSELREISPRGGDLIGMSPDSVTIRVMRSAGLVCEVDDVNFWIEATRLGSWFEVGDSVFVFADHDPSDVDDDVWTATIVTARDTTQACATGGDPSQRLTLGAPNLFVADTPSVGGLVRGYRHYTYGVMTYEGDAYLGRKDPTLIGTGSASVPLAGPLDPDDGLEFEYLDSSGNPTTVATDVRQIQVTLRSHSEARDAQGDLVSDSVSTRIYLRN